MRQVELQRGHRDEAVLHRFQIGFVARRVLDRFEAEPEIGKAARIGALDQRAAAIVVEALPDDADALQDFDLK